MENENKKPKKSLFISKQIRDLNNKEKRYNKKLKRLLNKETGIETIGYIPSSLSFDNKERPLVLSREIVDKIENDHGLFCSENIVINTHDWDYFILNFDKNIDRINIIKLIPDSDNYLLTVANRDNGFYMVTHFETVSSDQKNLKRLLGRGNVVSRVPSACL